MTKATKEALQKHLLALNQLAYSVSSFVGTDIVKDVLNVNQELYQALEKEPIDVV